MALTPGGSSHLALVLERLPEAPHEPDFVSDAPLVTFEAFTIDERLYGWVRLEADRLTDLLNASEGLRLLNVLRERHFDGSTATGEQVVVARRDLIAVQATGPRGDEQKRRPTRSHPLAVQSIALLIVIVISSWFASRAENVMGVVWSPYQKLAISHNENDLRVGECIVTVNNVGYQGLIDLSESNVAAHPEKYAPELAGLSQYDLPGLLHPNPKSILIVGAGTGNDAAGALRNGVESITAVEIDPAIITIGKDLHSEDPYSNPNVRVVNDDARSFFATTQDTYDVISFGLLDSHSHGALQSFDRDGHSGHDGGRAAQSEGHPRRPARLPACRNPAATAGGP